MLASIGVGIIFITDKPREVLQACDRASVLKDGNTQGTVTATNATKEDLVSLVFGKKVIDVTHDAFLLAEIPQVELTDQPICSIRKPNVNARGKDGVDLKDVSPQPSVHLAPTKEVSEADSACCLRH